MSPPPKAQRAQPWTDPDLKFVSKLAVTSYPAAPFSEPSLSEYDADLPPHSAAATPARVTPPSPAVFAALASYPLGNNLYALAIGPNGSIWFSAGARPWFGTITDTGEIRSYQMPANRPGGFITMTPDQAMWIGQERMGAFGDSAIARVDSSLGFSVFSVHGGLGRLTAAADNSVWTRDIDYTGANRVIRISPTGEETDYVLPPRELTGVTGRVAMSADGSAWFVTSSGLGRLTADGNYYRLPLGGEASDLAFTKDGDLWVSTYLGGGGYSAALHEFSPAGQSLENVQLDIGTQILTVGPDDALWFQGISRNADYSNSWFIGRVAAGKVELFQAPDAIERDQLVVGNSLWYSTLSGLNRFTPVE